MNRYQPICSMLITCATSLVSVLFLSGLASSEQSPIAPDTLVEEYSFGGEGGDMEIGQPVDLALSSTGDVLILDAELNQILICAPDGKLIRTVGSIGSGAGEFSEPQELLVTGDRVFVADQGNLRIAVLDSELNWLDAIPVDYIVSYLMAGPQGTAYAGSNYRKTKPLNFYGYDSEGKLTGMIYPLLGQPEDPWNLLAAYNRLTATRLDEDTYCVAHVTLAHFVWGSDLDRPEGRHTIDVDVDPTRSWFYFNLPDIYGNVDTAHLGHQLGDYMRDMQLACAGGKRRWLELISDVVPYGDNILLAVSSTLQEYDRQGALVRRTVVLNRFGQRAYIHRIAVTEDGNLFGLDYYHTHKCRYIKYARENK